MIWYLAVLEILIRVVWEASVFTTEISSTKLGKHRGAIIITADNNKTLCLLMGNKYKTEKRVENIIECMLCYEKKIIIVGMREEKEGKGKQSRKGKTRNQVVV